MFLAMRVGTILLVLLGALVALVLLLRWAEPHLVYFPSGAVTQTPAAAGLAFEAVTLDTADGERLQAWWVPAADAAHEAAHVLLFFHGNAGSREHRLHNLQGLHAAGIAVLIFDYRGYGGSSGTPGEAGLLRDGEAAYDWLRSKVDPRPIVFFGRSLGAAVAARVALRRTPAALILESAFTRAADMARRVLPLPGVTWIMRTRLDAQAALRHLEVPLLMIHGDADEVVPYALGRRLFESAITERKTFHTVPGGHHNDTYVLAGPDYWRWLREFLASVGE